MSAQSGSKTKLFLDACGLTSSCDDPYTQANDRVRWQRNKENPLKDNHYEYNYFNRYFMEQAVKFCKLRVDEGKKIIISCTEKGVLKTLYTVLESTYPELNIGYVHGSLSKKWKG